MRKRGETEGERIGLEIGGRPGDKWGGEYRIVSRGAPAFEDLQPYEPAASGGVKRRGVERGRRGHEPKGARRRDICPAVWHEAAEGAQSRTYPGPHEGIVKPIASGFRPGLLDAQPRAIIYSPPIDACPATRR